VPLVDLGCDSSRRIAASGHAYNGAGSCLDFTDLVQPLKVPPGAPNSKVQLAAVSGVTGALVLNDLCAAV